ncbi:MAG: SDR family oxidoreductase [Polyangiaceae bacterium]
MDRRRVVVITGASAGVGRAAARAFGRDGADVGLIARGNERLAAAREELRGMGRRAVAISADVADAEAVERAAEKVEEELGPIDVWVNGATVTVMSRIAEMTAEEIRRVTEVTYLGCVHGTLSALRRMIPRRRGVIVQVGSALAYRAIPLQGAYSASKHAMRGFTDSLRCELMHDRIPIDVTMVQLPGLNTPQFEWSRVRASRHPQPVPPIYQPEVAARAIVTASYGGRREMFVGTQNTVLAWGNKLAPWMGDRYLAATGFDSQFTDEPISPGRPDNLFEPAPGNQGAHGSFDDRAIPWSAQLWANEHRGALLFGGAVMALWAAFKLARGLRLPESPQAAWRGAPAPGGESAGDLTTESAGERTTESAGERTTGSAGERTTAMDESERAES